MGARPLRRVIEQYLEDPLAEKILMNPEDTRRTMITVKDDALVFVDKDVSRKTRPAKKSKSRVLRFL